MIIYHKNCSIFSKSKKRLFTEQNYNHLQKISEKWRKLRKSCNHNRNIIIIQKEKLHYNFLQKWTTSRHDLGDKGIWVKRNEKLKLQPSTQSPHQIATLNIYFKLRYSVKPSKFQIYFANNCRNQGIEKIQNKGNWIN